MKYLKIISALIALLFANTSFAAPVTTKPPLSMLLSTCTTIQLLYGGGSGLSPQCLNLGTNLAIVAGTLNATGGSGSPGGSNTQVQYNNAGAFAGITGATTDGTTLTLVAPVLGTPASVTLTNASGTASSLVAGNATKLSTPRAIGIAGSTGLTATGVNFDGSAAINPALTGTLAVANGGTGDTGTAWSTYSPTPTCGSGSLTTSSSVAGYKQLGKTVFIRIAFTITTVGTCAGTFALSLPVNPLASTEMSITHRSVGTGVVGGGRIRSDATPNNSITGITTYDGATSVLIAGNVITFNGVYEAN